MQLPYRNFCKDNYVVYFENKSQQMTTTGNSYDTNDYLLNDNKSLKSVDNGKCAIELAQEKNVHSNI
jgi:hypothetical protein